MPKQRDIVLVPIPFTDLSSTRRRPVIVISNDEYNRTTADVVVEANEPGRFLDCVEQVDALGVAEAAADEIAPLRQHPDPRVRMYAVAKRTGA